MGSLFDQLKCMYDEQLYSNVATLATMLITINENNYLDYITPLETFQTYCYYADALFHMGHYSKAESFFKKALQLRKSLLKPRVTSKLQDGSKDFSTEADIKYKMHQCYHNLDRPGESIEILQSIPAKQRSVKINMSLAISYDRVGLSKQAISAYKEVLKAQPLALEAAERLLALKVPTSIVIDIMSNGVSDMPTWSINGGISSWINAIAHARSGQWATAVNTFKAIDTPGSLLKGCPHVLVALGEVNYYSGDYKQAIAAFQRAHSLDRFMLRGLEIYAACLSRENRLKDCAEMLLPPSMLPSEYTHHHWLTLAHLHVDRRRLSLAAYFAQQACFSERRNPECLLLKGNILMGMKKYTEALDHFREAMEVAPDRYESYAGLAEVHIALRRARQAIYVALDCCRKFNHSPRALTLYANILLKEGDTGAPARVRDLLKKAISIDNKYLPASLALARLIDTEDEFQSDISILENQVLDFPTSALHQALGEMWARKGGAVGTEHAAHHYGAALALEPGSRRALDALARLDRTPATKQGQPSGSTPANSEQAVEDADNTYELVAEANAQSDNSNAPEESETEAVWSDMDLEVA